MNPWAALLGPVAPPALRDLPRQVHILADEVDHSKLAALPTPATPPPPAPPAAPNVRKRASRAKPVIANVMPGAAEFAYESEGVFVVHLPAGPMVVEVFVPKVRLGAAAIKQVQPVPPIPRLAKPAAGPGPGAYRVPKPETAMNYADAIRIRERARMHQSVAPYLLEEANKVVEETRRLALSALESST